MHAGRLDEAKWNYSNSQQKKTGIRVINQLKVNLKEGRTLKILPRSYNLLETARIDLEVDQELLRAISDVKSLLILQRCALESRENSILNFLICNFLNCLTLLCSDPFK
ncbi:hypothetical protein OS493_020088 [Desmophyllum pertusum]|uniref:Uncharacterized protein n=1 Tax=Desmophyllum pertusum TaxID=174260 RepID=A0A9W9YES5_9CNID|nr:hypothetical protein OS493_020088 [Desmophyllum pertusum]